MLSTWLKSVLEQSDIGQADMARRLTERLGRSIDRAAVNKMITGGRKIAADELLLIAEITGRPAPLSDAKLKDGDTDYIIEIDTRAGAGGGGIPVDAWQGDGNGNNVQLEGVKAQWQMPTDVMQEMLRSPAKYIRAFEVMGNSMEPRLNNGDRVFVDIRYREPHPEGIFALWDGYGVVIKQLQIIRGSDPLAVRIISINTSYAPYDAQVEEINIIGRYAGRFTVN